MNTDEHGLKYADLTSRIIDVFFSVYNELGPGFLESVHVEALAVALGRLDWHSARCRVEGLFPGPGLIGTFRADLIVGAAVLRESSPFQGKAAASENSQVFAPIRVHPCSSVAPSDSKTGAKCGGECDHGTRH
jgi:GxxExxY protein